MPKPELQDLLNTRHEVVYGAAERISPLIRRVTAPNPGPFTFRGTGTFLVGTDELAVIDPGPEDSRHIDALLKATEGQQIAKILVTHTHGDHSPAARPLARLTGAPILGFGPHPAADPADPASSAVEEPGDRDFVPEVTLESGDLVEGDGWTLECLHTPGRISNHLCFALPEERCVFTGDHVMGWSSVVIPPPDGSLGDYLTSLRLLLDRGDRDSFYLPAHGPAVFNPAEFVEALMKHRLERSRQIVECLRTGGGGRGTDAPGLETDDAPGPKADDDGRGKDDAGRGTDDAGRETDVPGLGVGELVRRIYVGLAGELIPAAETTVLAHLIHLVEQGEAACAGKPTKSARFFPV